MQDKRSDRNLQIKKRTMGTWNVSGPRRGNQERASIPVSPWCDRTNRTARRGHGSRKYSTVPCNSHSRPLIKIAISLLGNGKAGDRLVQASLVKARTDYLVINKRKKGLACFQNLMTIPLFCWGNCQQPTLEAQLSPTNWNVIYNVLAGIHGCPSIPMLY